MHACRCDEINGGQEQCVYVVNATSLIWVTSNLMQIHAFVTELEEQSKIHRMRQQQQQPAPSTIAMASRIIFWRRHRHLNSLSLVRSLSLSVLAHCIKANGRGQISPHSHRASWIKWFPLSFPCTRRSENQAKKSTNFYNERDTSSILSLDSIER